MMSSVFRITYDLGDKVGKPLWSLLKFNNCEYNQAKFFFVFAFLLQINNKIHAVIEIIALLQHFERP